MKKSLLPLLFGGRRPKWAFYNDFTTGVLDSRFAFSRATPAWQVNSAGILVQAAANAPRFAFDPVTQANLGLQFEAEARTNSIPNAVGSGGSPTAPPTGWFFSSGALSSVVVAFAYGTEDGIPYVDFSLAAVNSTGATTFPALIFNSGSPAATSAGSVWTSSVFARKLAGSSSIAQWAISTRYRNSSSALINTFSAFLADASGTLSSARQVVQAGAAAVNTASAEAALVASVPAGESISITLRLGIPQLELGSSASSPIPTAGAAITRAADVCAMTGSNFSSWYAGATECTLFSHSMLTREPGALTYPSPFRLLSADFLSRISLYFTGTAVNAVGEVVTAGVGQGFSSIPAPINSFYKGAERAATNNLRAASNGALGALDATVVYPNNLVRAEIGSSGFMGFLKAVGVATRGMTDAELISTTIA